MAIKTDMAIMTVLVIKTDKAGKIVETSIINKQLKKICPTSGWKRWEHLRVI